MNKKLLFTFPFLALVSTFNVSCNQGNNNSVKGDLVYLENSDGYCVDSLNNSDRSKVTEIVVPSTYKGKPVNEISKGAFKGCTNLTNITLPFIGHTAHSTGAGGLFGYVFGDEIWEGAGAYTWQTYSMSDEYDVEPTDYAQFVVPKNLKNVTITHATTVAPGAFSMCKYLRNIKFEDTCNIEEIGNFAFYTCTALKDFNFPKNIKTIGRQAFMRCYNLINITVPNTVTNIKHNAFSNCISLTNVYIPASVEYMGKLVFSNMLAGVILLEAKEPGANWNEEWSSASTTVVYDYDNGGFYYTNDSEYALCGKGDDKYAFLMQWIGNVEGEVTIKGEVTFDNKTYKVKTIGPRIFEEADITKLTINEGVEKISGSCFNGCANLESVTFPNSLTEIGHSAFINCSKLGICSSSNEDNVLDLKHVKTIGKSAFQNCSELVNLKLGDSLETIGESAFENDEKLMPGILYSKSGEPTNPLVFPKTIKTIGKAAFKSCFKKSAITSATQYPGIKFEDNNINDEIVIEESAFENTCYKNTVTEEYKNYIRMNIDFGEHNKNKFKKLNDSIFKDSYIYYVYNFPNALTSVGNYSFYNCRIAYISKTEGETITDTRDLIINKEITSIGKYGFYYNYCNFEFEGAKDNTSKLTTIGDYAFQNCNQSVFETLYIPNSVTSIGVSAFNGCTQVKYVHFPHNSQYTEMKAYSFSSMSKFEKTIKDNKDPIEYDDHVIVPDTITYLSNNVFSSDKKILHIEFLSDKITYVGSGCFSSCEELITVTFASLQECATFGSSMFSNCYKLTTINGFQFGTASSNKGIGESCYLNCRSIVTQTISSNIQTVGAKAFMGCTNLESITFDGGITNLYASCFAGCNKLTHFDMKDSVHTICDYAFQGCTALGKTQTITDDNAFILPSNISQAYDATSKMGMGDNVFAGWTSEQYIFFSDKNISSTSGSKITLRWDWELELVSGNIYKCSKGVTGGSPRFIKY